MSGSSLAATADPTLLIPGSLTALYDDAHELERQAGELDDASGEVSRRVTAAWLGRAAARWDERRTQLAASLGVPAEVYRAAAEALRAHARVIEWAREQVEVAIELWERGAAIVTSTGDQCRLPVGNVGAGLPWTSPLGQSLRAQSLRVESGFPVATSSARPGWAPGLGLAGSRTAVSNPFTAHGVLTTSAQAAPAAGPGGVACEQAERLLVALRTAVERSALEAAEFLDACCADMPDGQFHLDQLGAGLWDWAFGIGELALRFSTPRMILDWDGFWADGTGMVTGPVDLLEYLAENPHEFNRLVLDSETFRDNPGRWFGRVAPDAALAVLAGAGVVSKVAKLEATATRALDNLADAEAVAREARVFTSPDPLVGEVVASAPAPGSSAYAQRLLDEAARAEEHLRRVDHAPANDDMLQRIRSAAAEGRPLHESEENFLRHELTEAELMDRGLSLEDAHELAMQTHPTYANYHPEVVDQNPEWFGTNWRTYWGLEPR